MTALRPVIRAVLAVGLVGALIAALLGIGGITVDEARIAVLAGAAGSALTFYFASND